MAKSTMPLSALAPNPNNPRRVTPTKLEMLQKSLKRYGDLSGIVFNEASGQLIGGHQRCEVAHVLGVSHVTLERTFDPPTSVGTTAEGFILLDGEPHRFRRVRWDKKTEKAANIAANAHASTWDMPALASIMADLRFDDIDLDETMFGLDERDKLLGEALKTIDESDKQNSSKSTMCPSCGHEF